MAVIKFLMGMYILVFIILQKASGQISSCKNNTCMNGGTCLDQPHTTYGFSCLCSSGFTGNDCRLRKSDINKPIVGGTEGSINVYPNLDPQGSGSKTANNRGGGNININPNGGGGVSIQGGDINIGGGGGSGMGSFGSNYLDCLNGGFRPRSGVPCMCPAGFSGPRCEINSRYGGSSSSYNNPNTMLFNCLTQPCMNGGRCLPRPNGYYCECRTNHHGPRCEYYTTRTYNYRMGGLFGSLVPLLLFCCLISLCIYCCCRKKGLQNGGNFMGRDFFNFGGPGRGGQGPFPAQPPPTGPTVYYPQPGPGGGGYPMGPGVYNMQTRQQTVPLMTQDPDQVFKVNASPPPYEQIVTQTNNNNQFKPV